LSNLYWPTVSVTVLLATPLAEFTAVTVTPGITPPLASRIDPVSVVAAPPGFTVVDGSTTNVGAAATAGGFAGVADRGGVEDEGSGVDTAISVAGGTGATVGREGVGVVTLCAGAMSPSGRTAGRAIAAAVARPRRR
jgi:hypothetical protein